MTILRLLRQTTTAQFQLSHEEQAMQLVQNIRKMKDVDAVKLGNNPSIEARCTEDAIRLLRMQTMTSEKMERTLENILVSYKNS